MENKKKLIRVTTADISLDILLKGQLRYLNDYFEVVGVAADTGVLQKVAEREGIRTINIPMHREISLRSDWQCLWQLVRLFRKEKPDIVHTNTPKGSLLSMIAAKIAKVPHRIYLVTGLRYQGTSGLFRWMLQTMERITCFCATKVIPEGNGVKAILQKDHITRKPLMLVHNGNINGIDTDYFSAEQVTAQHADIFTFIFIGRIVGDKGMNELADAIRQLKEDGKQFKVILVGNFETELDPLQGDNETFLRTAEEVEFVGYQKDVRPFLAQADALVFPSYREGFPNVVLQAGSMGLASIVTNISGCNEIIKDGLNGRIIQPRNTQALYHTMRYFIEHPAEVRRMAGNARGVVKEKFEQKDVWRALLETYKETIEKK